MSDYAGPILGVVGAVVGFVVTGYNPQGAYWGWAIGSALGGMYSASQQVIPGPKIGDVQKQTSQEGGFRPIVFGRSIPMSGNVIADSEPRIVKKEEDQGKGGPKVETEYAYRTYAVGFCEGEAGLLQAWRNGILVADFEDPSMSAENAKFLEYATWHTGTFDQAADPDLEAVYGVGDAPFFRGTAYLVLANEDVTDQRGAWSQWQVRVFRSASVAVPAKRFVLGAQSIANFGDGATFADTGVVGLAQAVQFGLNGRTHFAVQGDGIYYSDDDGVTPVFASSIGSTYTDAAFAATQNYVYFSQSTALRKSDDYGESYSIVFNGIDAAAGIPAGANLKCIQASGEEVMIGLAKESGQTKALMYSANAAGNFTDTGAEVSGFGHVNCVTKSREVWIAGASDGKIFAGSNPFSLSVSPTSVVLYGLVALTDGDVLGIDASGNIWHNDNDGIGAWTNLGACGATPTGNYHNPIAYSSGRVVVAGGNNGVINEVRYSDDVLTGFTWATASTEANDSRSVSGRIASGSATYTDWTLPDVIEEVCGRANLTSDLIDLTLIDPDKVVRGYTIGNSYMAAGILQTLSGVFFFDPANKNGKVAFIPRGRNVEATILQEDMIDDGQEIEERKESSESRKDGISIPRVLHLNYHDVAGGLNTDKQRSERPEGTRAEFEQSLQTPVVLNADEAASVVAITHGLMAEQQKGELNFALPDNWIRLIESDPVFVETDTKMVRAILARVQTDEGEQRYKAVRDRQSLYTTVVQGIPAAPVTRPPSSVAGVTLIEFLDIPILRDSNDLFGFNVGVSGLLPAWPGATVDLSLDGGATYIQSQSTRSSSIMGELVSTLGDHPPEFPDEVNTCQVQINTPDVTLENTDLAGMLNRRNRAIIGDEIVNFATADEVTPGIWELSYWLRGRKQTDAVAHSIGDRFVMLDTTLFVPAELSWLGQTLTFRATTFGRPVDEATIISATFTGASQTEFYPAYLQARRDGTDLVASWQGVGRLGGGAHVAMGAYFQGFRITLTDGSVTQTFDQTGESITTSLSAFTGPVTVRVQQRNQLTGLGPYIEVII